MYAPVTGLSAPGSMTRANFHRAATEQPTALIQLPAGGASLEDLERPRRALHGLYAILQLHFAQEDDLYSLFEE